MGVAGPGVPVEELSSRHQLQDERDLGGRLEDLLQLDLKGATGGMRDADVGCGGWLCREERVTAGLPGCEGFIGAAGTFPSLPFYLFEHDFFLTVCNSPAHLIVP